jgi:carbon monoxide dehydrogenase subunit G
MALFAIVVVVLLAVVLGYAAVKPDDFRIQRTARIKAAPDKIFASINDFHRWDAWSPYEKYDATMRKTHSGAASGKGAVYEWEGNSKVGKGRMEITDVSAPNKVMVKLDFMRPFVAHNTAEFTLNPSGESTEVTWSMSGARPYVIKVMGIFLNMDKMVGKDFEAGLANLKTVAER